MIRIVVLSMMIVASASTPANAGCFLFFCWPRHHHARHHHHRVRPIRHVTIVKKVVVVRHEPARKPAIDRTPITPLK